MVKTTREGLASLAGARQRVGGRLRALRTSAKMTQVELGLALGVSQSYVSSWERGAWMPSIPQMWAICGVLKCSMDDLAGPPTKNSD